MVTMTPSPAPDVSSSLFKTRKVLVLLRFCGCWNTKNWFQSGHQHRTSTWAASAEKSLCAFLVFLCRSSSWSLTARFIFRVQWMKRLTEQLSPEITDRIFAFFYTHTSYLSKLIIFSSQGLRVLEAVTPVCPVSIFMEKTFVNLFEFFQWLLNQIWNNLLHVFLL